MQGSDDLLDHPLDDPLNSLAAGKNEEMEEELVWSLVNVFSSDC